MKFYRNSKFTKICLLWSILAIIIGITEKHIVATVIGIFFTIIFVGLLLKNKNHSGTTIQQDAPTPNDSTTVPLIDYTVDINNLSNNDTSSLSIKKEKFKIAGVSYYEENFKSLFYHNPLYDYSKKDLIEDDCFEKIYEYETNIRHVDLIPEPDNPYDTNAIKVIFDDKHIGYIKKGSCSHVKNLLKSGHIKGIDGYLIGGKYKQLFKYEEEDEEDFDIHTEYELEYDTSNHYAYIIIYTEKG